MATEGELIAQAEAITHRMSWMKDYRQKWLLIRHYCEAAIDLQKAQKRIDMSAYNALTGMVDFAKTKVDLLSNRLVEVEAELATIMKEIDPDVQQ